MTITNSDFAEQVLAIAREAGPFRATATYDPDGDCIEFLAKPDPFYGERIDSLVTVYYSQDTGEVIGSLIKGVKAFCREFSRRNPGFRIVIEDGPTRLEHIFLARLWSSPQDSTAIASKTYKKLIEVAGETEIEGELCCT